MTVSLPLPSQNPTRRPHASSPPPAAPTPPARRVLVPSLAAAAASARFHGGRANEPLRAGSGRAPRARAVVLLPSARRRLDSAAAEQTSPCAQAAAARPGPGGCPAPLCSAR
uniref:Uncharacterized protein n=1 Tax=Setaria viridis TaxID=4556 RepID=A0A4U6VUR7_SETVI|nr:hypothetical protein SEVIR_2G120850v2 [Setaria viridis]